MVTSKKVKHDSQDRIDGQVHFDTPTRTRVQDLTAFCQAKAPEVSQNDIFAWCGVSKQRGYEMLESDTLKRRKYNRPDEDETRGRKPIFGQQEWKVLEDFILNNGFDGRVCGYMEIVQEVLPHILEQHPKLDVRTVRKAFHDHGYGKCTACQKPWLTRESIVQRQQYFHKRRHWTKAQWRRVRFSDEWHIGQGTKRKLKIIRKRDERYCTDCIQKNATAKQMKNRNTSRYHFWISVGYNHKEIVEYQTSTINGKMTQKVYLETILQGPVQRWLDAKEDFILEEDQDSGHGTSTSNSIRQWKDEKGLNYFFNASGSPDLSPAENTIRATKQHIYDFDHFDDEALHKAAFRAFAEVDQKSIDRYIDSMIDRVYELGQQDFDMTKW